MFEIGEYVVYGTTGVCKITDITHMDLEGVSKEALFYIMQPYQQSGSKIFISVNNQKTIMRKVLTKQEADTLIDEIPNIEELWIENDKLREAEYKTCFRSCQSREWVKIIKSLYLRKIERLEKGKKITATDERYLKMAEDSLYTELSISLDIPKGDMEQYITERIEVVDAV